MPFAALIPALTTRIAPIEMLVDGYPEVAHKLSSRLGTEPVESGVEVHDHVTALPARLELEGSVSDLTQAGAARPAEAYQAMARLHASGEPFEVITAWRAYGEMVIESLDAIEHGGGMRFTVKLQAVNRITLSGEGTPERFVLPASPAKNRPGPVALGAVEPPVVNTIAPQFDMLLAEAPPDVQALEAFMTRDLASLSPPRPPTGISLQHVLDRAADITSPRTLDGVAASMFQGMSQNGAAGLSQQLGHELRQYGLGPRLPDSLAQLGRLGSDMGGVLSRAGDARLGRRVEIASAARLIRERGIFP